MHTPAIELTLEPIKCAPLAASEALQTGVAALELSAGQDAFVGVPAALLATALVDPARHPMAIVADGDVVGFCILHVNAAMDAGWRDADSAVLLRGFMIDRRRQGRGYGTMATLAAVERAELLARELALPAKGVVLGVNERNVAGQVAYGRAGFTDSGQYLGGRSGPQRTMYKAFVDDKAPLTVVNSY